MKNISCTFLHVRALIPYIKDQNAYAEPDTETAKEGENTGYYDSVTGDDYNQNDDNLYDNAEAVQVSTVCVKLYSYNVSKLVNH